MNYSNKTMTILNQDNSNTIKKESIVLLEIINISDLNPLTIKQMYLNIIPLTPIPKVSFYIIQIPKLNNYTYDIVKEQIINNNNNRYLDKKIVEVSGDSFDNNDNIIFNISNLIIDDDKNVRIAIFLDDGVGENFNINFKTEFYNDIVFLNSNNNLLPVNNNSNHMVNIISSNFNYRDVINLSDNDKILYPFCIGANFYGENGDAVNQYIKNFPFGMYSSLNYYIYKDYEPRKIEYHLLDWTGNISVYYPKEDFSQYVINEIDGKKQEVETKVNEYLMAHKQEFGITDEICADIKVNAFINILFCTENKSFLYETNIVIEYLGENTSSEVLSDVSFFTLIDSSNTTYLFTQFGSKYTCPLYLDQIILSNGETLTFEKEPVLEGTGEINSYVITKITEPDIEISYIDEEDIYNWGNIQSNFTRYFYKTIDSKKEKKRVEFNYEGFNKEYSDEIEKYEVTYIVYDYSDESNIVTLKNEKLVFDEYAVLKEITNLLTEEKILLTYDNAKVKTVSTYLKEMTTPYESYSFSQTSNHAIVENDLTNEKVYYYFNQNKNVYDIICGDYQRITIEYDDNNNITNQYKSYIAKSEIANNNFKDNLNYWSYQNANIDASSNQYGLNYIKLHQQSTIMQNLSLLSDKTYVIKGRIKNNQLGDTTPIVIEGSYLLAEDGIGGPTLSPTDTRYYIEHVYMTDQTKNDWYEFTSESFTIPHNAYNITAQISVFADNDIYIDRLEVVDVTNNFVATTNSYFTNDLNGWSYNGQMPEIILNHEESQNAFVKINPNGYLSRNIEVLPNETYIFRGTIKKENPTLTSLSKAFIELTYYEINKETGVINSEQKRIYKETILDQLDTNWHTFICDEVKIPDNVFLPTCIIKIETNETLYVSDVKTINESVDFKSLNDLKILPTIENLFSEDNNENTNSYIVSNINDFSVENVPNNDDIPLPYGNKVIRINGNKLSNNIKKITKHIEIEGKKNDYLVLKFLVKTIEYSNEALKATIKVHNDTTFKTYKTDVPLNSNHFHEFNYMIKTEFNYTKIEIELEYSGQNDLLISNLDLLKQKLNSSVVYDDLGKKATTENNFIVYNNNSKPIYSISNTNFNYYKYNNNDECTETGNIHGDKVEYHYDETGRITKIITSYKNEENSIKEYIYENNHETNELTTMICKDSFDNQTTYIVDKINNSLNIGYANNHILSYKYNKKAELIELLSNVYQNKNEISYTDLGNVLQVKQNNDIIYSFEYNDNGLLEYIKLLHGNNQTDSTIIKRYQYNEKGLLIKEYTDTKQYHYEYDDKLRVTNVKYSNKMPNNEYETNQRHLYQITYDRFGNVMLYKNEETGELIYYLYNDLMQIYKVINISNNETIEYCYDLQGNITNKKYVNLGKTTEVEYSEKKGNNKERYIYKLLDEYNADIILGINKTKGLLGLPSNVETYMPIYDPNINMHISKFETKEDDVTYNLKWWNNKRSTRYKNLQKIYVSSLKEELKENKTISIWIKPLQINGNTVLYELSNASTHTSYGQLQILENKKIKFVFNNIILLSSDTLQLNNWNLISLSLQTNKNNHTYKCFLSLNGYTTSHETQNNMSTIDADCLIISESSENTSRLNPFEMLLLSIDAHKHTLETLNSMYSEGLIDLFNVENNRLYTTVKQNNNIFSIVDSYDHGLRYVKKELVMNDSSKFNQTYEYNKTRIEKETNSQGYVTLYTYDNMNNIVKKEIKNQLNETIEIYEYTYDSLNRITQEKTTLYFNNQPVTKKEYICDYTYQNNNNLYRKTKTQKTYNENIQTNQETQTYIYIYDNTIKDKLKSYMIDDTTYEISYVNNLFNPSQINKIVYVEDDDITIQPAPRYASGLIKTYELQSSYAWDDNRLTYANGYTYTYNSNGQRIKKQKDSLTHTYVYDGNKLIKEEIKNPQTQVDVTLEYIYDQSDMLVAVLENNNLYYYERDLTGEIKGIIDTNGNYVIKYRYNAFGEVEKEQNITNNISTYNISTYNPFMYKGYYYDVETGWFWLSSRYYSPELCRFISPDDIEYLDPESVNGLNLYCYCMNNPIMYVDPTGHSWESFWNGLGGKIVGTVLVIGAMVALSIATAGVGTAVVGALGGGFWAAVAGGAVGGAISGAIFGAGISMISQGVTNGYSNIDYGEVAIEGLIGMASGAATGALFAGIGRGLGLLGKTKWAQRTLEHFDDVSKNYFFGSESGNFTFLRNGKAFRLEASLQHGLHYHSLAAGTTAHQWQAIFKGFNLVAGLIGGGISNAIY